MNEKQYININGAEYSADFDFFLNNQILVRCRRDGTVFFSRLNGMRFTHTSKRNLSDNLINGIIRQIHTDICNLNFGGYYVD